MLPLLVMLVQDTIRTYTLPAETVSVTRATAALATVPLAVHTLDKHAISAARPTWGLDEALAAVPGVYVSNRYNFSVDQRLSIRGFGARSAFAVRGVKVLVDGIPQTLPDGQGQLTNLELGAADRIEVLNGSASALFGNAAGGVISIATAQDVPARFEAETRIVAGAFDRDARRTWSKWQFTLRRPAAAGAATLTMSRLAYAGERDHTAADLRTASGRWRGAVGSAWSLALAADVAADPRADNPGALTLAELAANRDSAAALNLLRRAGKDVRQAQAGATLKRSWSGGGEAAVTMFGLTRDLTNPLPQAYIKVGRGAYGIRASGTRPWRALRLTGGADLQWQRDDRHEYSYAVPNGSLTTPDNNPDTLTRNQLEQVVEVGLFTQAAVRLAPRWETTAGARYDRVRFRVSDRLLSDGVDNSGRRTFAAASGSWGLTFAASPRLTLYANAGSSFETPTTTELNNQPPPGGGGFNPALRPQRAWTYEAGARGATRSGALSWSAAAFQANVRDELIGFEDSLVPGRRYFRNAAGARHRGLEIGAGARLGSRVTLSATWTYADYRYTAYQVSGFDLSGRAIPGMPRHWVHTGVRVRPRPLAGGWLDVATTHSSGFLVDDTLAARTGPWWTADLRAGWDGKAWGLPVAPFVALGNAFNRKYEGSVVINAARGRYYEPAPGRNLYVGMTLQTKY